MANGEGDGAVEARTSTGTSADGREGGEMISIPDCTNLDCTNLCSWMFYAGGGASVSSAKSRGDQRQKQPTNDDDDEERMAHLKSLFERLERKHSEANAWKNCKLEHTLNESVTMECSDRTSDSNADITEEYEPVRNLQIALEKLEDLNRQLFEYLSQRM